MAGRHLSADERAAWAAVTRTVRALRPPPIIVQPKLTIDVPVAAPARARADRAMLQQRPDKNSLAKPSRPAPAFVLDGSWEKRIRSGRLDPDYSVDLHGLTVAAAHVRLDLALGDAMRFGWRVLLIITGKPRPAPAPGDLKRRGAIRAEISHWLASSAHSARIASVRQAHPRHGGEGALYIILRKPG